MKSWGMLGFALLCAVSAYGADDNAVRTFQYMDQRVQLRQRELKEIYNISFGADKTAHILGLDDQELTDYAILKFRNNFAGTDLAYTGNGAVHTNDLSDNHDPRNVMQKGGIEISLQTAFQPKAGLVAYSIEMTIFDQDCTQGMVLYDKPKVWNTRIVGMVHKNFLLEHTKKNLADLLEKAALDLMKNRGQLSTQPVRETGPGLALKP